MGVGCHFLLQGIFPTQGLNPCLLNLLHWQVGSLITVPPEKPPPPFFLSISSHWKDWCWSWYSNSLATWWEELTHLKRPWSWERLKVGGKGDDRGWDGWMASLTQWTWVWVSSRSWWWTGRPGVLQSMGSQKVRHDWVTELNSPWSSLPSWIISPSFKVLFKSHLLQEAFLDDFSWK